MHLRPSKPLVNTVNTKLERRSRVAAMVDPVDIVFDVYCQDSRKRETRDGRGKGKKEGVRISISQDTPLYKTFSQILSVDGNKTELNALTAWAAWAAFPELTKTLVSIAYSDDLTDDDLIVLQKFIVLMYSQTCPVFTVNEARRYFFTKHHKPIENCPPTLDSLMQHIKRAILQCLIWMEGLCNSPAIDMTQYGWVLKHGIANPVWDTKSLKSV